MYLHHKKEPTRGRGVLTVFFYFYISAVLIPLFGLHFIISAFVPNTDIPHIPDTYAPYGVKSIFDSIQAVTTSFQVCVIFIYFAD